MTTDIFSEGAPGIFKGSLLFKLNPSKSNVKILPQNLLLDSTTITFS